MPTIYNTADAATGFCNVLLYGLAGAGKTPLAATCPAPIVVTSEPGLLSLRAARLPYVVARTGAEALEVANWLSHSNETKKYQTVFYDSISETSDMILIEEKRKSSDPRKFSPSTTARTMEVVRAYLNIGRRHTVMTCKANKITVETTQTIPGAAPIVTVTENVEPFTAVPKLGPQLPYLFDYVFYLSRHVSPDGQEFAALRCRTNGYCHARDRSGRLELWERPDISHIIAKANG